MFSHKRLIKLAGVASLLLISSFISAQDIAFAGNYAGVHNFLPSAGLKKDDSGDKEKAEAAYKSPDYDKPEKYTERLITINSGGISLPAILTLPKGKTKVPLVVLVHDAGAHDKDMTVGANKPFRDIALGLASHGVATLRYDNRTQVYGARIAQNTPDFTVQDEVISDAVAALNLVKTLPGIDQEKLYILGHGFGGMMAPRIAKSAPFLNGIILMATPARSAHDYILDREEYEFSVDNQHQKEEIDSMNNLRLQVGNVRNFSLRPDMPSDSLPLGLPASYWLDLRGYNQGYEARKLPQRIMVLHPERDYQVTMHDLAMWQQSLHHRGKQFTPVLYSNLNHLMQEGKSESTPSEYLEPKNVPMYLIRNISTWVRFGL